MESMKYTLEKSASNNNFPLFFYCLFGHIGCELYIYSTTGGVVNKILLECKIRSSSSSMIG